MGTGYNPKGTECYYYVKGRCHCREEGDMYCTQKGDAAETAKGAACDHFKRDMSGEQWKEKYWSLMRMLREKVQK